MNDSPAPSPSSLQGATDSPVLVEVLRGGAVESVHRGAFVVVDAGGTVVAGAGQIDRLVFPRSAVKPFQALPLLESGAVEAMQLTTRHVALACASHKAEPGHTDLVRAWLAGIGLGSGALECGAHAPGNPDAAAALIQKGEAPSAVHNNCSGKHSGFLCTAVHLGEDPRGYIRPEHPVQRRVSAAIQDMTGADLAACPCGTDGCGIPSYAIPLRALARGMARMVDSSGLPSARAKAAGTIMDAMAAEPFLVAGTGSFVTECMRLAGESVRVKTGAEGVYVAALPRHGYGVALKIEDGASRAAELAIATLLRELGCFSETQERALAPFLAPVIPNAAGLPVGALRPADALAVPRAVH